MVKDNFRKEHASYRQKNGKWIWNKIECPDGYVFYPARFLDLILWSNVRLLPRTPTYGMILFDGFTKFKPLIFISNFNNGTLKTINSLTIDFFPIRAFSRICWKNKGRNFPQRCQIVSSRRAEKFEKNLIKIKYGNNTSNIFSYPTTANANANANANAKNLVSSEWTSLHSVD